MGCTRGNASCLPVNSDAVENGGWKGLYLFGKHPPRPSPTTCFSIDLWMAAFSILIPPTHSYKHEGSLISTTISKLIRVLCSMG